MCRSCNCCCRSTNDDNEVTILKGVVEEKITTNNVNSNNKNEDNSVCGSCIGGDINSKRGTTNLGTSNKNVKYNNNNIITNSSKNNNLANILNADEENNDQDLKKFKEYANFLFPQHNILNPIFAVSCNNNISVQKIRELLFNFLISMLFQK